jgi:8-oxoguanine deaminase
MKASCRVSTDLLVKSPLAVMTGLRGEGARHDMKHGGDIRIRGGKIAAIGNLARDGDERVIDASGCVVYPGWVNTHHHLFQSLLKGIPAGINLALVPWLSAVPVPYRRFFDREEALRIAARIGIAELLLSGCTTVADHQYHYYPDIAYDASEAVFSEAAAMGVRFALLRGGQTHMRVIDQAPPKECAPEPLDLIQRRIEADVSRYHDPSPFSRQRVASAITTPTWSCTPDELRELSRHARSLGIRMHSHLSETYDYVKYCREIHNTTPVDFCEEHEWLGPDVWFAHMVHVSPAEIAKCAATGTGISHCPQSNCRLGSGIAHVPDMLAAGVPVSLAVDGAASNEAADMANEAHTAWMVHRAASQNAAAIDAETVIHIGTQGGARVLGWDGLGTLEIGKAADLAVYSLDHPRYFGLHDMAIGPVVSGGGVHCKAVVCDGRVVVDNGVIPGLDMAQLKHDAQRLVKLMRDHP